MKRWRSGAAAQRSGAERSGGSGTAVQWSSGAERSGAELRQWNGGAAAQHSGAERSGAAGSGTAEVERRRSGAA